MIDLRLAVRVIRGGGAPGAIRMALMVLGLALGAVVVLLVGMMPSVLTERGAVSSNRQPLSALAEERGSFSFQIAFGAWHDARVTRVLVTRSENAPLPPGVSRLPGPGEVLLSPAAAELASRDVDFKSLLEGTSIGEIGPAGLLGPSELYAYVGVQREQMGRPAEGRGWGGSGADEEVKAQFGNVPFELALIIVAPMAIYLNVCSRLSAATRTRRYAALRLLGLPRRQVLRLAALESAAAGLLGGLLGIAGYGLANRLLGPSGVLGFTWYPSASELPTAGAVAALVLITLSAALIGAQGTSRALARPVEARFDTADKEPRWWYGVPFVLGLGLIGFPLLTSDNGGGRRAAMSGGSGAVLIAGVLCATVGLLLVLRPLLMTVAGWLVGTSSPLAVRLAARRVRFESAGLSWHLGGLCVLILTATIGAGVLRQSELAALPAPDHLVVQLSGNDVPAEARDRAVALPAAFHWLLQKSITAPPSGGVGGAPQGEADRVRLMGVQKISADCRALRMMSNTPLPDCRDGELYRLRTHLGGYTAPLVSAGTVLPYLDAQGTTTAVEVPEQTLDVPNAGLLPTGMALLDTRAVQPRMLTSNTIYFFRLPSSIKGLDRFASALVKVAPAATMSVIDLDLDGLEAYHVHQGVVYSGIWVGFLLGIVAFLISAIGRSIERRRHVASLVVVGTPVRTLRAVQAWQLLAPLALALVLALGTGHLAANALLLLSGQQIGWYLGAVGFALPLVAVALAVAGAVSLFVSGLRPRPEDLRRE
ncbi:FtsX-like permease family protein [Kitasatospora sp. NPDC051853]|uniref:FtsX-like permease family protein n=1 Tax=Kitasatospora sp. NPDC051853 TaxID=3364058 RepID=UPI0037AC07F5